MITKIHRISHLIFAAAIFTLHASLFTSCSLDEEPRDQIPEEEAYTTAQSLFQNTVATLYTYIGGSEEGQGLQGTIRGVYDLQTFGSDEAMLPTRGGDWYDGGLWRAMYRHSWDAGNEITKNSWLYLYKVITLCNHSLEQIETHKSLLNLWDLAGYTAEVRALRAIYYWYLLDLFGNVPLITSTDISLLQVKQTPRAEVFNFVVRELQDCLPYLVIDNSVHSGNYYGRVTYPVGIFVLAKLMLNAEVYSGTQQWEKTIGCCDILEDLGFRLEEKYRNNFVIHNENSKENIWTIPMDRNIYTNQQQNMFRSLHYRHAAAYGFTGENGTCATRRVLEVNGYGTDQEDNRLLLNYWVDEVYDLNDRPVYDRAGQFLCYYPWEVAINLNGSPYLETAGARMYKYEVDKNATKDGKLMDNDIVLFRYADVLLMRAEAKLRLTGSATDATYGTTAQEDYDAIRDRADMERRPLTLKNLYDERLIELCWEGWRRQDQIRFGQYESLFEGDEFDSKIDESDGHTTLYPIPADVMAVNHNLVQNPGY